MIATSFIIFMILFVVIGGLSILKSRNTTEDYLLAEKSVPAWLAGLSAVATNNSGFMFIAMIGITYTNGLSSIWLMFGWILGDLAASLVMVRKIREVSNRADIQSFGGLLSSWQEGTEHHRVRQLVGILTVLFLGAYAAAQFKAGAKAMEVFLDWEPWIGLLVGSLIVLIYSIAGGIRASIWTDAAQSIVMIVGMALLVVAGVMAIGSPAEVLNQLQTVQPGYMHWLPDKTPLETFLFITGWLFGGFAVMGQPHIVVRYMSLDNAAHINRMRFYYYSWYTLFYGATILVGLLSRIVLTPSVGFDAEQTLPIMAVTLLPEIAAGLILAAIFAATMSTADSLVLSCSAAITQDFSSQPSHSLLFSKLITAGVVLLALLIALSDNQTVFKLVLMAWGLLASAFLPLLWHYALGQRCSERVALTVMFTGILIFLAWRFFGLGGLVYEVMPGILSGLIVFQVSQLVQKKSV
jgi:SSS family transporter